MQRDPGTRSDLRATLRGGMWPRRGAWRAGQLAGLRAGPAPPGGTWVAGIVPTWRRGGASRTVVAGPPQARARPES